MKTLILLVVLCLAGIGGLFAIRFVVGVTAVVHASPEPAAPDATDLATPLPKGDRLPSQVFDGAVPKAPVETVKIVPTEAPRQSEASKDDVVSWHWREGSKVVRRRRAQ